MRCEPRKTPRQHLDRSQGLLARTQFSLTPSSFSDAHTVADLASGPFLTGDLAIAVATNHSGFLDPFSTPWAWLSRWFTRTVGKSQLAKFGDDLAQRTGGELQRQGSRHRRCPHEQSSALGGAVDVDRNARLLPTRHDLDLA